MRISIEKMPLLKNGVRMSQNKQKFPGITSKSHRLYLIKKNIGLKNLANW